MRKVKAATMGVTALAAVKMAPYMVDLFRYKVAESYPQTAVAHLHGSGMSDYFSNPYYSVAAALLVLTSVPIVSHAWDLFADRVR